MLLRFEFLDKAYEGFLLLRSEHGYREYRLPESGGFKAFGVKRGRSKVLSLWNSGTTIEHVRLTFQRVGAAADGEFGLNYLCAGYLGYFRRIDPVMREMATLVRRGLPASLAAGNGASGLA